MKRAQDSLALLQENNEKYLFYGLSDSGVILKELGQNLRFSVKSEVLARVQTPSYT